MHMDGAWDTFWIKSQNGTFIALQMKSFGPKKFEISSMGKKVPFWQFFRLGCDGRALLGQPSKGHPCRILILFPYWSTISLAPHIPPFLAEIGWLALAELAMPVGQPSKGCPISILIPYIISTTYQKIGDLLFPVIFLNIRTVWSYLDYCSTGFHNLQSLGRNHQTKTLISWMESTY